MTSHRWFFASTAVLVGAMVLPGAASAQLFFDWGGQQKVNDSGRKAVRINADAKPGEIIVSFTDRKLYLITAPGRAISYPVAIPREQDRWEGRTRVSQKRENPSWTPTPSMLKENPRLPRWVPGGHPMNPLGVRALYLGSSYYRIHGTDAPWTIGTAVSKGCIRMYNKDALDVYEQTRVGAHVLVTWKSYETTPDTEQLVATRQDSPAAAGSASPSATQQPARAAAAAAVPVTAPATTSDQADRRAGAVGATTGQRQRMAESRYSEIFGTNEPPPVSRPARSETPATEGQPARSQRQSGPRETQAEGRAPAAPQREPRRAREAASEASGSRPDAAPAAPVRKREVRQQPAAVETGALPDAAPRAKTSPAKAAAQPVAAAKPDEPATPPGPSAADIAAKALAAAERAAAAAERAAAAAERAERAALAKPAAPSAVPAAIAAPASAPFAPTPPAPAPAASEPAAGTD